MSVATEPQTIDKLCVDTIRTLSMDAVQRANSGHPGTPMALAPVAYVLYTRIMRHAPTCPDWPDRDRFVLSCGHASMLLYSVLHLAGYQGISLEDIKNFRQLGSPCAGHPEYGDAPGIETTTGPLGQGMATAVGLALGERIKAERFNTPEHTPIDSHTYVVASDGDMQEGVQSEAASLAGHLGLGRLIAFYDDNHISIEGDTALAFSEDVGLRYEGYGWHVQNLGEDLSLDRIEQAVRDAQAVADRPSLIIVRTHIAPGAPTKQDTAAAHGAPLGEDEIRATKQAYGWPTDEPFHVPSEALAHFRGCVGRGEQAVAEWEARIAAYRAAEPELAAELDRLIAGRLADGWDAAPPVQAEVTSPDAERRVEATRKSSARAINWLAPRVPELIGGSADLAPSNNTLIDGAESIGPHAYGGRNLHFGIREHGMGAVVNGLVLAGLRGYGATFLIFSDYMKASMRIAALAGLPSIFVFTHDSIGLGEDGPTHQPIEQLASLRATPRLHVVRPADANESLHAWRYAVARSDGPCALAFSRQGVPTLDPDRVPNDCIERGAYVLAEAGTAGAAGGRCEPRAILIATGTEVHIALGAREALQADGIATRVVSMPCMDRFAEQDAAYRDAVLPPALRARVAVEAAASLGWHRWVGESGAIVAMERFGESAPYQDLYDHFGFTPAAVAEQARATVARVEEGGGR